MGSLERVIGRASAVTRMKLNEPKQEGQIGLRSCHFEQGWTGTAIRTRLSIKVSPRTRCTRHEDDDASVFRDIRDGMELIRVEQKTLGTELKRVVEKQNLLGTELKEVATELKTELKGVATELKTELKEVAEKQNLWATLTVLVPALITLATIGKDSFIVELFRK